jgi:hypothetical protein
MPKIGILPIEVTREGQVDNVVGFLSDVQEPYENLYLLELKIDEVQSRE